MARCETCGNDYDKPIEVRMDGESHTFDSFECAMHMLAPTCGSCGVRIVGHGMEAGGQVFCCQNCAQQAGVTELRDRA